MIKEATLDDIEQCVEWAREFHKYSAWSDLPFDAETVRKTLAGLVVKDEGLLLLTNSGMIGAVLSPMLFNQSIKIAYELFWWRGGMKLIRAYEDWAKSHEAIPLMVCLDDENTDRMAKLYERRGYTPTERYFRKG